MGETCWRQSTKKFFRKGREAAQWFDAVLALIWSWLLVSLSC